MCMLSVSVQFGTLPVCYSPIMRAEQVLYGCGCVCCLSVYGLGHYSLCRQSRTCMAVFVVMSVGVWFGTLLIM